MRTGSTSYVPRLFRVGINIKNRLHNGLGYTRKPRRNRHDVFVGWRRKNGMFRFVLDGCVIWRGLRSFFLCISQDRKIVGRGRIALPKRRWITRDAWWARSNGFHSSRDSTDITPRRGTLYVPKQSPPGGGPIVNGLVRRPNLQGRFNFVFALDKHVYQITIVSLHTGRWEIKKYLSSSKYPARNRPT
jgi:hypothetical protein